MIKAEDLRIGNLVRGGENDGRICGISLINFGVQFTSPANFISSYTWDTKIISYIPITEEWLGRFGFRKSIVGDAVKIAVWASEISNQSQKINLVRNLADGVGYVLSNELNFWPSTIIYVHQLQNLYYALTGEELILTH